MLTLDAADASFPFRQGYLPFAGAWKPRRATVCISKLPSFRLAAVGKISQEIGGEGVMKAFNTQSCYAELKKRS
jgi:hypothetical protein